MLILCLPAINQIFALVNSLINTTNVFNMFNAQKWFGFLAVNHVSMIHVGILCRYEYLTDIVETKVIQRKMT